MSNSSLAVYKRPSPNCTMPRNKKIDTITIHCMAGNLTVEDCGNIFADKERQGSSNYGIGSDGRIALYVDEANRSWCTSSSANDHRAVTIEVANCGGAPDWPVSDKAYAALLDLVTDICKRNGIKQLLWKGDKNLIGQIDKQNMTVHRWFAAKSCPGDYLYNRHAAIAQEVNRRVGKVIIEPNKEGDDEVVEKVIMRVNGEDQPVQRILKDSRNYVQLNDLKELGVIDLAYDEGTNMVSIDSKK